MSSEGACPLHPAIRLKRYNRRTGEWKTLLETCPLCASGLPATSSSGASAYDDYDDEGTVSSRSSRFSRSSRPSGGGSSYGRERDSSLLRRDGGHANPDDRSTYSTATTHTGTTGATDQTYVTDSKSLSSMSTRKQRNSVRDVGGRDDYATDDDNGYKTEDHDSDTDMDSSNRSSLSRGVRFGPGTKEGSELGTDLDSDGSEQDDRNYLKESIHSNYDPYDGRDDDVDNSNPTYNTNNDLNNFMMNDMEKRSSASSQYSNTPNTKAPLPSALKPSSFGPSHHEVTAGSIVLYDGHKTSEQHNSSLTSLHDDRLAQQQQYPVEKQKYRPPPPPRREEEHSPNENAIMCHDITPAPMDKSSNRSASRSRNERSASRSRDVRPAPPQRAASQPRSSSRGRGTSTTRQRDSSRSRPKEGDSIQPSTSSNGKHALPPGRSRSRSRQPSRSRGREDSQPTVPPQQPPPPVGILKNGIRNNVGSTQPYNPKEAKDAEETLDNIYYDDNATRAHANHPRQPVPPPRSSGLTPPPLNNNNTRMRMEPPETPQEELDSYSTHSRDSNRRHAAPPRANIPPPNHPGDQPRGNPQDHRRRLSESSGQLPLPSVNSRIPQPPRSSPMYLQNDPRDNASMNSYENRSQEKAPPRLRGMQPVADRSESSHEPNQPRAAKNTPKKNRRSVDSQPGFTESETNASDAPSANADHNDSETPVMAQASAYDDKGRCVKHPHIKLRKKKLLGGWKVMLVNCPDCCIEEMLKMRRNGPGRAGQSDAKGEKVKRSPSEDSHSSAAMPPISQLTIRNKNDDDQSSSSGSASEITYGTKTDYSRSSAMGSWQQYGPGGHNNPSASADNSGSGSGPHRVTRMPFTDAYGHKGWYTGEVASGSGLPHGKGTMHYCDGRMRGGLWSNGLAAAGGGSGGTLNKMGSKSSGSGSSVSSQHSHHSRKEHPPPSLDRESVVVGMEWMDLNGRCGFFTGETDEQRKPHGMGSMRYNDGKVLEGEWHHGEFDRHGWRGDGSVKSSRSRSRGTAF